MHPRHGSVVLYSMDHGVQVGLVLTQSLEEPVQAENPCPSTSSSASVSWNFESEWVCSAKSAAQVVRLDGLVCLLDYGSETLAVVSLDASAAYDGISRQTILHELRHLPEAAALLPFARLWLGRPSSFVWHQKHQSSRRCRTRGPPQPCFVLLGLAAGTPGAPARDPRGSRRTHPRLPRRCHHPRVASASAALGSALRIAPCAPYTASSQRRKNGPME